MQVMVHKILVITIAATAVVMLAEIRHKDNVLLTVARALLVGLQGIWFIQIGYILFRRETPAPAAKVLDLLCEVHRSLRTLCRLVALLHPAALLMLAAAGSVQHNVCVTFAHSASSEPSLIS